MPHDKEDFTRRETFSSRFHKRWRRPFPQEYDSTVQQFATAFELAYTDIGAEMAGVAESRDIFEADADELNLIGARFGPLGLRRGRGNGEYRRYIQSLIETFKGRGTAEGIAFAVAAGVGADRVSDVDVADYPEEVAYGLRIHTWADHSGTDVRFLADLADPSGVTFKEPLEYEYKSASVGVHESPRIVERTPPSAKVGVHESDRIVIMDDEDRFDGQTDFGGGDFGGDIDDSLSSYHTEDGV